MNLCQKKRSFCGKWYAYLVNAELQLLPTAATVGAMARLMSLKAEGRVHTLNSVRCGHIRIQSLAQLIQL